MDRLKDAQIEGLKVSRDAIPEEWGKYVTNVDAKKHYVKRLQASDPEWKILSDRFVLEMNDSEAELVAIYRVFNLTLHRLFMDKVESLNEPNVRLLWHGSDLVSCEQIIRNGFKLQHVDTGFGHYGNGIYFATDLKLAHWFTETKSSTKIVLLSKVACGNVVEKDSLLNPKVRMFIFQF